jgi:cellulose synthase operon protein C
MGRRRSSNKPPRVLKRKRLWITLGVAVGVLALAGGVYAVQLNRQAPSLLRLARKANDDKDYATAAKQYEKYLEFRPNDAAVHTELAEVYFEFARVTVNQPFRAADLRNKATEEYERALQFDSNRHDDRRKLARLYIGLQKYSNGRKHTEELLKSPEFKSDPELHEFLAACELQNYNDAAKHLRKAIETGKAGPDTYRRLAYLLKYNINSPTSHAEADDVMRQMVTQDRPNDLEARLARARYYTETNRRAEAQADIRHAFEKLPGGKENVDVILAHADTTSLDDARGILRNGLAAHPDHPELMIGLAEIETRAGRKDDAAKILNALSATLASSDPLLFDAADRLLDLNHGDVSDLLAKLSAEPAFKPVACYLDGRYKLNAGDWPAALPLLTQAVPAVTAHPTVKRKPQLLLKANLGLAVCYGQANDPEKQAEAYHSAFTADGSSIQARLGLAEAFLKLNRADDASNTLKGIAGQSPAANTGLARLKLYEALRQPPNNARRFEVFWELVGRNGPYPADVAPIVATAHLATGEVVKAEKVLEAAVRDKPTAQTYVTLSAVRTAKGADDALAVLAEAEKKLGPVAEILLARAVILARDPVTNAKAIAALAKTPNVPEAERFKLLTGLGELLIAVGKGADGVPLLQEAAQERKFDLGVRLTLFDWAVASGDAKLRDDTLREIRQLDGADGVIGAVAEVTRDLRAAPKLTPELIRDLSARLRDVRSKRESWGRIPYLLGVLAKEDGRGDEALEYFQTAISKGERSDLLVRDVLRMLMQRQRYTQAYQTLNTLRAAGGLSPELERQYRLMSSLATEDRTKAIDWVSSKEAAASTNHLDHLLRGLVLAQNGKRPEAEAAFTAAQNIAPNAPEVYVTRVRGLVSAGAKPDELRPVIDTAVKALQKATTPNPATVPLAVGQMYELIGEPNRAADEYQKARRANLADLESARRLFDVFVRSGNRPAADGLLDELTKSGGPDVLRWARRTRASQLIEAPDWHKKLTQAVQLIDANLADGEQLEDVRAKAFALARDPFQRQKAVETLRATQARGPFTPDEGYRLATLHLQAGKTDLAEQVLADVTRGGILANPLHLATLARIQLERGDTVAARATVNTLKLVAAGQPLAVIEEARLLAKTDSDKAAAMILALPTTASPGQRVRGVGQVLESIGCSTQAEKVYTEFANGQDERATAHLPLAEFQIRRGRAEDAIQVALDRQQSQPDCPPSATARVVLAAVRSKPMGLVPESRRAEWEQRIERVDRFLSAQDERQPNSAEWLSARAELADARGRHTEAITLFKKALSANRTELRVKILNNLAGLRALAERDGSNECLQLVNEAIGEAGPEPYLLDTRAVVHMAGERYEKAIEDLAAAAAVRASPVYQFHLAVCSDKLNDRSARDTAITVAKKLGMKKESLHPVEWAIYDRLIGK